MPASKRSPVMTTRVNDDDVLHYLKTHPEFFTEHGNVLHNVRVPHPTGFNTVSLIEKQADVLRQKNQELKTKLHDFVSVAHDNDVLINKIYQLAENLIATIHRPEALQVIEDHLREHFGADRGVVMLYNDALRCDNIAAHNFTRVTPSSDPGLSIFSKLINPHAPRCAKVSEPVWCNLFQFAQPAEAGSVALIPLGEQACFGVLAIGNHNEHHFHPGMSTEFLSRLGSLVTSALVHRGGHSLLD